MRKKTRVLSFVLAAVCLTTAVGVGVGSAQEPAGAPPPAPSTPPSKPSQPVQKIGDNLFRLGQIRIDTAKREIVVPGTANQVALLEFVANTRGGQKAYESAITLETDGIDFNVALLLIGLDVTHSRVPTRHFDPLPPQGDRVAMWVEWNRAGEHVRVPAEELLFNKQTQQTAAGSEWVYTGSVFLKDGRYLANMDGVLIGFVHSPAPVIENIGGAGVNRYGAIVLNPNLHLDPDTPVTLTVKALAQTAR